MNTKKTGDLIYEKTRLSTFTNWPYSHDHNLNAKKMAEAGFYYVKNETSTDLVKCFLCEKELDCWDENDDPIKEHLIHNRSCMFAKFQCPEDDLTLDQFLKIKQKFYTTVMENEIKELTQIIALYEVKLAEKKMK